MASGGPGLRLPVAEQPFDLPLQGRPVDVAGHGQDHVPRVEQGRVLRPHVVDRDGFDALDRPPLVPAERVRVVALAQFEHHLPLRLVFGRLDVLQAERLGRVEFVLRQVRAAEDVGVDRQGREQVAGEGRPRELHVDACPRSRRGPRRGCRGRPTVVGCRGRRPRGSSGRRRSRPGRTCRPGRRPPRPGRGTGRRPSGRAASARPAGSARWPACACIGPGSRRSQKEVGHTQYSVYSSRVSR